MKKSFILLFLSNLFISSYVYSMDVNEDGNFITLKLIDAFRTACENKRDLDCSYAFITKKFLVELKQYQNKKVLESTIYFKKSELGKIKNSIPTIDNSLRTMLLQSIEATKNAGPVFGDINIDNKTVCSDQFYQGNGDRGWFKCKTFLN